LAVNAQRVQRALQWLKIHYPLYKDVSLNEECLQQLEVNPVLPFPIEHIHPSPASEAAAARYGATPTQLDPLNSAPPTSAAASIPLQNVVITDVDCHASSNELRAAALRHVKQKGT
jgi:hypothetical protein